MFDPLGKADAIRSRLTGGATLSEGDLIDVIREAEEVKAAAAAVQAAAAQRLAASREAQEAAERMPARRRGRGLASEIGLARRESPVRGSQHLGTAKALAEMPHTFRALETGRLSEWRATIMVRETAYLSFEARQQIDRTIGADTDRIEGWGDRTLIAEVQKLAYAIDPHAVVGRARRAAGDRHVSVRPAPDVMSRLSALLPVAQGVACYAALKAHADTLRSTGDERSRGQITSAQRLRRRVLADALVERLTGRAAAEGPDVGVTVAITDRTLFGGNSEPAYLEGYGIVPAQWARDLVRHALGRSDDGAVAVWFRQLYTHPVTGALVAMASQQRRAPAGLASFIAMRDRTCRTPWCDAPIRHTDHVWAVAAGGPTTAENTQGLCEQCNHAKEAPGWRARSSPGMRHLVVTRTPTGHVYRSTARPMPGHEPSWAEAYRTDLTVEYAPGSA